jgi:Flp pilus assembly protein TadD
VDPSAAVAANNLAWIYSESGRNLDIALQLAQTAHSKLPEAPEVADTLGFLYYKKNLLPQAIQSLRAAVEKDPTQPGYHYHLGLALAKSGDAAGAKGHLTTALSLKRDFAGSADARNVLQTLDTK